MADSFADSVADFLRAAGDLLRDALRRLADCLQAHAPYGDYDETKWRWDGARKRWILKKSEEKPKSYNCSEYTIARIESRPPKWGGSDTTTVETHEIFDELARLNWIQREEGCNCGCGEGQSRNCVVVYTEGGTEGKHVVHVAIFDHVRCDWGGKLNSALPIARYKRPEDYYENSVVPENARIMIFCPRREGEAGGGPGVVPGPGGQKDDEWMHDNAVQQP